MTGAAYALLAAGALLACAAGPPAHEPAAEPGATVRLDVTPGPSYRVAVVAHADEPASGTYALAVERVGAAGRSRSRQGGPFDLGAGQRDTLSVSTVNAARGDSIRVELAVEWADGTSTEDSFERVVE